MQTINGYTIRNVTISTTKSQNPIDGEMYYVQIPLKYILH